MPGNSLFNTVLAEQNVLVVDADEGNSGRPDRNVGLDPKAALQERIQELVSRLKGCFGVHASDSAAKAQRSDLASCLAIQESGNGKSAKTLTTLNVESYIILDIKKRHGS
jgi:hypothetical protein